MQTLSNYKYNIQRDEITLKIENSSLWYKPYTHLDAIQIYNENDWTLPDSLIIAIIIWIAVKKIDLFDYSWIDHSNGCRFKSFAPSSVDLNLKTEILKNKGVSCETKSVISTSNTTHYKLDKTVWTKDYKQKFIALLQLKGLI